MTALEFLISMRPAIPMSAERPCTETSNGELKRWMLNNAVLINKKSVKPQDILEFPIIQSVFFPKSETRKTTVI
jgi:hypothetical protein